VLLGAEYARLPALFRPPAEAHAYLPLMLLAHVILAGAFAWIYLRGREAKPWLAQGARYGLAIAILTVLPTYPGSCIRREKICGGRGVAR